VPKSFPDLLCRGTTIMAFVARGESAGLHSTARMSLGCNNIRNRSSKRRGSSSLPATILVVVSDPLGGRRDVTQCSQPEVHNLSASDTISPDRVPIDGLSPFRRAMRINPGIDAILVGAQHFPR
jgi:hypothetical protein